MNDQQIQELINQFDTEKLKEKAYFGFFDDDGYDYIKANKEGLMLYAINLIIASEKIEKISNSNAIRETIPFGINEKWIDRESTVIIHYIQKYNGERPNVIEPTKSNFFEKLIPIGCFLLFIIFGVSFFVGLAEIVSWFS